jgi:LysM repeat protein
MFWVLTLLSGQVLAGLAGVTALAAPPAPVVRPQSYLVKTGDTLYSLSKRFGLALAPLRQANPGGIRVGQPLQWPAQASHAGPLVAPAKAVLVKQPLAKPATPKQTTSKAPTATVAAKSTITPQPLATRQPSANLSQPVAQKTSAQPAPNLAKAQVLANATKKPTPSADKTQAIAPLAAKHSTTPATATVTALATVTAAPTTPTTPVTARTATTHTVASKETLFAIARRYGLSAADLKAANQIGDNTVKVGQVLQIPAQAIATNQTKPELVAAKRTATPVAAAKTATLATSATTAIIATSAPATPAATETMPTPKISTKNQTNQTQNTTATTPATNTSVIVKSTQLAASNTVKDMRKTTATPAVTAVTATPTATVVAGTAATSAPTSQTASKSLANTAATKAAANKTPVAAAPTPVAPAVVAPTAPTSPLATMPTVRHTVVAGDMLSFLARRYGTTVDTLRLLNNLVGDNLMIGQVLLVPEPTLNAPAASSNSLNSSNSFNSGDKSNSKTTVANITASTASSSTTTGTSASLPLSMDVPAATPDALSDTPNKLALKTAPLPDLGLVISDKDSRQHIVTSGDTLSVLALRYGTTVEMLKANNNLASDSLQVGQMLNLPAALVTASTNNGTNNSINNSGPTTLRSIAETYLGVPYRYGGTTRRGIDCSAFVQQVFGEMGVDVPRTSRQQYALGTPLDQSELQYGDLVFFNTLGSGVSHVGIYLGDGEFIHAATIPPRVTITALNDNYWSPRYIGARRVASFAP